MFRNIAALKALLNGDVSNFSIANAPGGIERQEAQGQLDLVHSTKLPTDCRGKKHVIEAMGVVFGEQVDDLFTTVQLPKGWAKKATDHSMWSKVIDERGRERISVFYKAAFYDLRAFMEPVRLFSVGFENVPDETGFENDVCDKPERAVVFKGFEVVYRTEPVTRAADEEYGEYLDRKEELRLNACNWLNANYRIMRTTLLIGMLNERCNPLSCPVPTPGTREC